MPDEKQTAPTPPPKPKSGGSNLALIIIIIVVAVAILGVGGYFGWKYYQGKISAQATINPSPLVTVTVTASPTTSPSPTATLSISKVISGNYVIADSDTRVISESELYNLTPWQLKVARNEIYARLGRPFVHKDLQCYFATKSWYHINQNFTESMLSTTENKNVATIKNYEQEINSPLQSKDSGC